VARVFVSHSSKDSGLAAEVHGWLVAHGHDVFLDRDLADGIAVGEDWQQRLHEQLRRADAMVCLVTSAYVSSVWCAAEVGIAQSRGSRVLPLLIEPGVAHPLLRSVQHVSIESGAGTARAKLAEALRRIDAAGGSGWPDGRSPFPGLQPFTLDQRRAFFGRTLEVNALAELLRSPAHSADAAMLLVVGPSGCGKSSLVRAGLLPMMAEEPEWLTSGPLLPGVDPVAGLSRELAAVARTLGLDWRVAEVSRRLQLDGGLVELADELMLAAPFLRPRRLLLVIDQLEELLTQTPAGERSRFVELLRPALGGPVHVVATLRPDFLDQLLLAPELAALPTRTYTLSPLRRDALAAVIEEPAKLAGIDVDQGLVAQLVTDTESGDALPLLAYTLAQLTDGVGRGGRLLASRYQQLGGVHGTLTRSADAALDEAARCGADRDQVIRSLLRLVTVDEQGRPTRWRLPRSELATEVVSQLEPFVARRLLTTDSGDGGPTVEVAHESFLTLWPPLSQAVIDNATALGARRAVERAAEEWSSDGHAATRLWERGQLASALADTGARLAAVREPAEPPSETRPSPRVRGPLRQLIHRRRRLLTDRVDLSPRAREFLQASISRDRRRRARLLVIVLFLVGMLAVGLGVPLALADADARQSEFFLDRMKDTIFYASRAERPITEADTTGLEADTTGLEADLARYDAVYGVAVMVVDRTGAVVATSRHPPPVLDATGRERVALALDNRRSEPYPMLLPWDDRPMVLAEPVLVDTEVRGAAVTVSPTAALRAGDVRVWSIIAAAGLLALVLAVVVSLSIVRWIAPGLPAGRGHRTRRRRARRRRSGAGG
jgi:hypothetical protein